MAAQIADRIAVLYAGRVAEVGLAADVLERPAHPYTVGLLRSRLTFAARRDGPLPTLAGEPPDPRALPPGCPFAPRCSLHEEACDAELPTLVPAGRHPAASPPATGSGAKEQSSVVEIGRWPVGDGESLGRSPCA